MAKSKRKNSSLYKIISASGILVWIALAIMFIKTGGEVSTLAFYILLFSVPSLITIYFMDRLRHEKPNSIGNSFIFNTIAAVIFVDFAVYFIVYASTFHIGS